MSETPAPSRLDFLGDRRRSVRFDGAARAYSNLVGKLRWVLPILAFGILAVLLAWPAIYNPYSLDIPASLSAPSAEDLSQATTENRLLNPDFSGQDDKGQPFQLTAKQAVQERSNPGSLYLEAPAATMSLDQNTTINLSAVSGIYEQDARFLSLMDKVTLTSSDGMVLTTNSLYANLAAQTAETQAPVSLTSSQGSLTAQSLKIETGGSVFVFKGPARLTIERKEKP